MEITRLWLTLHSHQGRLLLDHKRIPYKTIGILYLDIEPTRVTPSSLLIPLNSCYRRCEQQRRFPSIASYLNDTVPAVFQTQGKAL